MRPSPRNDTPFIVTRKSIERSSPSCERERRDGGEKNRESFCRMVGIFILVRASGRRQRRRLHLHLLAFLYYASCLPSASMVLSTLQKSLSPPVVCLSGSYIRGYKFSSRFYTLDVIKRRIIENLDTHNKYKFKAAWGVINNIITRYKHLILNA